MKKTLLTFCFISLLKLASGQTLFQPQSTYITGTAPASIAVGNFNNDTKPDIVTANSANNTVSLLVNVGAGTFTTQTTYTVGALPKGITVADFDGDTKTDIVTTNSQDNTISVILSTTTVQATYTVGAMPIGVTAADFNGDGTMDIATANSKDSSISVLLNTGTGTFNTQTAYSAGSHPYAITTFTFQNTSQSHIAVTNSGDSTVLLFQNNKNGSGTFMQGESYSVGYHPKGICSADFDGDGIADWAATSYTNKTITIFSQMYDLFNNFIYQSIVTYTVSSNPIGIATADFDNDGHLDIAYTTDVGNNIGILLYNGAQNSGAGGFNAPLTYTVGNSPYNIVATDFNADGFQDLATNNFLSNNVSVLLGGATLPASALNFDGVDDQVNVGSAITTRLSISNAITVEAWVNPYDINGSGEVIGNYNSPNNELQFLLRRENNNYNFIVDVGSGYQNVSAVSTATLNVWQHVACVWDGNNLMLYVNGILQATTIAVIGAHLNSTVTNSVVIGYENAGGGEGFNGNIDEVRIWNRPLCAAEIQHNMNGEIARNSPGLLAYYKFNQGNNDADNTAITTLADSSLNGYNGTINNFALKGLASNFVAPGAVTSGSLVSAFVSTVATQTNVTCNGMAMGTASVTATGAAAPFTYSWSPGNGTGAAQGSLLAGTYTCNINYACGTTAQTFTITQPNAIDATTHLAGGTITANNASATYQWVDCNNSNAPISGATNQNFTPVSSGNYAVIVSEGLCTATSTCTTISTTGIANYNAANNLQVYPNPFSNQLTIVSSAKTTAMLFDMLGNQIRSFNLEADSQTISLGDLAPGMYYLQVDTSKIKIIKQ